MQKNKAHRMITTAQIVCFRKYLQEQEKSPATIQKYMHNLNALYIWLDGTNITKESVICWKEYLTGGYAPASVNTMLVSVNGFFRFLGWLDLQVKPIKIQKSLFCMEERELTKAEYKRLIYAAQGSGNERLSLVIQTICATGIRVSELQSITAEAIQCGRAEINNKGKRRTIFLPNQLRRMLKKYLKKQNRSTGAVFVTRTGKPLDRSNIWRDMKKICESANVAPEKVFPHNLRHLFARTYYTLEKDLSRLADILGHTNINTTKIYTMESGSIHARQVERLGLIIT